MVYYYYNKGNAQVIVIILSNKSYNINVYNDFNKGNFQEIANKIVSEINKYFLQGTAMKL